MLSGHPLAIQLENCSSVESIAALLQEQARTLGEFKGRDGLIESIEGIVSILSRLSATAVLGDAMGLVRQKVLRGVFCISDICSTGSYTCKSDIR